MTSYDVYCLTHELSPPNKEIKYCCNRRYIYTYMQYSRTFGRVQELSRVSSLMSAKDPTGLSSAMVRACTRSPRYICVPESVTADREDHSAVLSNTEYQNCVTKGGEREVGWRASIQA